jgi:hypothetical protein
MSILLAAFCPLRLACRASLLLRSRRAFVTLRLAAGYNLFASAVSLNAKNQERQTRSKYFSCIQ